MTPDPRDDYTIGTRDPDTEPIKAVGTGERQRAAIALGILAIVALIVVGIMVAVLGRGSGGKPAPQSLGGPTGPAVTVTGGRQPTDHNGSGRGSHPTRPHRSKGPQQPSGRPRGAAVSCPTSAPCSLPDDVGNAVRALNAYRTAHGKPAVTRLGDPGRAHLRGQQRQPVPQQLLLGAGRPQRAAGASRRSPRTATGCPGCSATR